MKSGCFTITWNWNRLWDKWNEPPPTTPKAGLHPKKVILYLCWNWKGVLYYELLPDSQTMNSNKYCSQLDQLKAALKAKCLELAENSSSSIRIMQDCMLLWWPGKNGYSLSGKFWLLHHIHQALHLRISIYFGVHKILLMEKI